MSDSGFVDDGPGDREPSRHAATDRAPGPLEAAGPAVGGPAPAPGPARRRPSLAGTVFVVLVLGLLGFGLWAWSSRVHADDVAAYADLVKEIDLMDRTLVPQGHGEMPPCREPGNGLVTRTYPESTGPQAAELIGYLTQNGWTRQTSATPAFAHLVRTVVGHTLTIDVAAPSENALVESLTAHSPASSFGCLLR
ncbi:hypothetical protein [Terrabacter sp. BE26]|uniref:hypothetical protein n=1 Tax=Terrabacter sp. BE26 TaxID=2898152 RepID=UPI0035BE834D